MAYLFPQIIDSLGFADDQPGNWTSGDHRKVALTVLLANPRIRDRDTLQDCVKCINAIPQEHIRLVTAKELAAMGVPLP